MKHEQKLESNNSTKKTDDLAVKVSPETRPISRRRLAKAGAAAPVLMSLFSRPAWGWGACSPSGMTSGNASGHDYETCHGQGCRPVFWKCHVMAWEGTGCLAGERQNMGASGYEWNTQGGTPFSEVFGYESLIGSGCKLLQVLLAHEQAGNLDHYECHLICALLNAAKAPRIFKAHYQTVMDLGYCAESGEPYNGTQISQMDVFELFKNMNNAGSCYLIQNSCQMGFVRWDDACLPVQDWS